MLWILANSSGSKWIICISLVMSEWPPANWRFTAQGHLKVYYFLISVLSVVIVCGFSPIILWEGNIQPSPMKSCFGYQIWAISWLHDIPSELGRCFHLFGNSGLRSLRSVRVSCDQVFPQRKEFAFSRGLCFVMWIKLRSPNWLHIQK